MRSWGRWRVGGWDSLLSRGGSGGTQSTGCGVHVAPACTKDRPAHCPRTRAQHSSLLIPTPSHCTLSNRHCVLQSIRPLSPGLVAQSQGQGHQSTTREMRLQSRGSAEGPGSLRGSGGVRPSLLS